MGLELGDRSTWGVGEHGLPCFYSTSEWTSSSTFSWQMASSINMHYHYLLYWMWNGINLNFFIVLGSNWTPSGIWWQWKQNTIFTILSQRGPKCPTKKIFGYGAKHFCTPRPFQVKSVEMLIWFITVKWWKTVNLYISLFCSESIKIHSLWVIFILNGAGRYSQIV